MENPVIKLEDNTVAEFNFNFEELKNWATSLTDKYQNLIISEDQVPQVKKEMADLNKYAKEIDTRRKEFEKKYKARIDPVLSQIFEIKGIFDSAYNGLKTQVDNYETAEREKRKTALQEQINELIRTEGLQDYADRFAIQDKWLNKTTTQKSIKADLQQIAVDIREWLSAVERSRKMKEERIELVRQFYQMRVESFGFDLGKESFYISLCDDHEGTAVTAMIESAFNAELKYRQDKEKHEQEDKAKQERLAEVSKTIATQEGKEVEPVSNPEELGQKMHILIDQEKVFSVNIQFTVKASKLPEVRRIIAELKPLCDTWKNI